MVIPEELTKPVIVTCADGTTSRALGECAVALRQGLDDANRKIVAIGEIVAE